MAFEAGTGGGSGSATKRKTATSKKLNDSVEGPSVKSIKTTSSTGSKTSSSVTSKSSSSGSPYGKNYFGFGSKEAYAKAIANKLASGQPLSKREAAARFIQENPDVYRSVDTGVVRVPTPSSGTSFQTWAKNQEQVIQQRQAAIQKRLKEQVGNPVVVEPPGLWELQTPQTSPTQPMVSSTSTTPAPSTPNIPSASPAQTIGAPPTDIDVAAGTPATSTTNTNVPEAMSRTPSVFAEYVGPIATVPTIDELYNLYRQVTGGQENPAVREYLASPDFQSVLGGTVPFWMQADPVWRLYLQRLGMLSPEKSSRMKAMMQRLGGR